MGILLSDRYVSFCAPRGCKRAGHSGYDSNMKSISRGFRRRGFTLVELLAVIAIIGVLAAILLPVIGSSQRKANAADSLSNLRQIMSGCLFFAGDHDGRAPGGDRVHTNLTPYLQNVLDAKTTRTIFISRNADRRPTAENVSGTPSTYSFHGRVTEAAADDGLGNPISRVASPGKLIMVADGIQRPGNSWEAEPRFDKPATYVSGELASFSAAQLEAFLENNEGSRGVGPDRSGETAGWFRYCNDGAVAAAFADGGARLIKKGAVRVENLVAF